MNFQLNLDTETVEHAHLSVATCVPPETTLRDLLVTLKEDRRGAALICEQGRLVGIITERDVLRLMAVGHMDLDGAVGSVMVRDPVTLARTDTVGKAISVMSEGGYRRIPIVDDQKRPVGMLKVSSVLHYLVEHFPQVVYTLPPTPDHATQKREGA